MSRSLHSSLLLACALAVFAAPAGAGSRCDDLLGMIEDGASNAAVIANLRRGGVDLEIAKCLADNGAPASIVAAAGGLAAYTPVANPMPRVYAAGPPAEVYNPLRAGMTDDNLDFADYLSFLEGEDRTRVAHLNVRDRRWITVLDAAGSPVPDARVDVLDRKRDRVIWRGRSYGDGTTAFYGIEEGASSDLLVQVRGAGAYQSRQWSGEEDLRVQLDRKNARLKRIPVDIALIIDTTGSMGDEIEQIKATLLAVADEVDRLQQAVDLRWGAVLYRDRGDEYVTREIAFTDDVDDFEREIRAVRAAGGGDGPESLNAGLRIAVKDLEWRRNAARVGFLIADAEPHMDYANDPSYSGTSQAALANGVKIHTVAASGLSRRGSLVFRQIAQQTRGKFIFIEYGSLQASASSHGISGGVESNNLDRILFERIEEEVDSYGSLPDGIAGF